MINFLYKRMIKVALSYQFIKKRNAVELLNILRYGKLTCEICKQPISRGHSNKFKLSIDHIVPRRMGGMGNFDNLRITHRICNQKKADKYPKRR